MRALLKVVFLLRSMCSFKWRRGFHITTMAQSRSIKQIIISALVIIVINFAIQSSQVNNYTILKSRYGSSVHGLAHEKHGLREHMVVLASQSSNRLLRPLAESPNAQRYCAPQCLLEPQVQNQAPLLCLAAYPCLL